MAEYDDESARTRVLPSVFKYFSKGTQVLYTLFTLNIHFQSCITGNSTQATPLPIVGRMLLADSGESETILVYSIL